jgi:putative transposase
MIQSKNEIIKASLLATKEKRKNQTCRVFEVKIDRSHLNQETEFHLNRLFLESKWLYNHIISQDDVFEIDYKIQEVPVKVKEDFEIRELKYLSSQMRQSLIKRTVDNIRGLIQLKENGRKIGKLKFKSEIQSIPLKQYGNTYRILDDKYIRIQGIKQKIRVNGLDQIPEEIDIANGTLIHKHGDYYLYITTYQTIEKSIVPIRQLGIDFGIANQMTFSDGIQIQYSISINKKLRKLHKKLSRQELHGNNWNKTRIRLDKEYSFLNNKKKDIKNKIVHRIKDSFRTVCYQNENIKAWQRIWGRKILSTSIGEIISTLDKKVQTPVEVDRLFPSTKTCSKCSNIQEIGLDERTYVCKNKNCRSVMNRDHNSGNCILNEGLKQIGTERIELTPDEIITSTLASLEYYNSIPNVRASLVYESGSFTTLA